MKDIPGNHSPSLGKVKPSFATVLLSPLGVTARSNDRVRCTAFYFSQYHISVQFVSASIIFHKEVAKQKLSCSVSGRSKLHGEWYTLWGQKFLAK